MGRFSITRKKIAAASAVAVFAAGGVVAYAFFSGTGSGAGSGAVGSIATSDIHVIGTETTPLYPGGASGTVSFTAWNAGANTEKLSKIHLSGVAADINHSGCVTSVFTMPDVTVGSDGLLPGGGSTPGTSLSETGALSMADSGVAQDNCQGATLTLSFTTT